MIMVDGMCLTAGLQAGSTVKINFKNTGNAIHTRKLLFKCSSDVEIDLQGRNNISKRKRVLATLIELEV